MVEMTTLRFQRGMVGLLEDAIADYHGGVSAAGEDLEVLVRELVGLVAEAERFFNRISSGGRVWESRGLQYCVDLMRQVCERTQSAIVHTTEIVGCRVAAGDMSEVALDSLRQASMRSQQVTDRILAFAERLRKPRAAVSKEMLEASRAEYARGEGHATKEDLFAALTDEP